MEGKVIRPMILVLVLFFLLVLGGNLQAAPTASEDARNVVRGLINLDSRPLGVPLSGKIKNIDRFTDSVGEPIYYVVNLQPSGFVIVSGDSLVEPIIAFSAVANYDPSVENPLGALIRLDLPNRIGKARYIETIPEGDREPRSVQKSRAAKSKWVLLMDCSDASRAAVYIDTMIGIGGPGQGGLGGISDVRVSPFIQSKWCQSNVCGLACYNYFTPRVVEGNVVWEEGNIFNYPSGCGPTAAAQIMRYYQFPVEGIGIRPFEISVDDIEGVPCQTRGGDGQGGPYQWDQMVLVPGCGITEAQRRAIGALSYDIGVCSFAHYTVNVTGTAMEQFPQTFTLFFGYSNASIIVWNWDTYLDNINSNLDAGFPVMLGIYWWEPDRGHAVVLDGYGYNNETIYHHLNYGWAGDADAWYNLPEHCDDITYICNIFPNGTGDIISGRVIDQQTLQPISGVTVWALGTSYMAETNDKGIYALDKIGPQGPYTIRAEKVGYSFVDQQVNTRIPGRTTGNLWGINFQGTDIQAPIPNPMTWAITPYATGSSRISMTATTADDPSGVEYYFLCLSEGGHDSGWQDNPTYEDTGLTSGTCYSYKVKARDKSPARNETAYSGSAGAYTYCYPEGCTGYEDWLEFGKPECWCYPRQCHGDADGLYQGSPTKGGIYYVGTNDLNVLMAAWQVKEPPWGPGIASVQWNGIGGICADFAHDAQGSATKGGLMRVSTNDLNILLTYWMVKEPTFGPGVPADCLNCGRGQQAQAKQFSFEEIMKWVEKVQLSPDIQKELDEEAWLKFVESLKKYK